MGKKDMQQIIVVITSSCIKACCSLSSKKERVRNKKKQGKNISIQLAVKITMECVLEPWILTSRKPEHICFPHSKREEDLQILPQSEVTQEPHPTQHGNIISISADRCQGGHVTCLQSTLRVYLFQGIFIQLSFVYKINE